MPAPLRTGVCGKQVDFPTRKRIHPKENSMPAYTTGSAPMTSVLAGVGALGRTDEDIKAYADEVRHGWMRFFMCRTDMPIVPMHGVRVEPEEIPENNRKSMLWTKEMHDAGVELLIPYICNQTIRGGDWEDREGLWALYDRWEDYEEYIGPKPDVPPDQWMQREPDGRMHFNYPYQQYYPHHRYAPCPNNTYWHEWQKQCLRLIAQLGFTGIFIDNNILHCHCEHCQREFQVYLKTMYTPEQIKERFGVDNTEELKLSTVGDKVLWASAQREYLQQIHDEEPEEFQKKFDTMDMDKAIASEAGNGFHWGRAHNFWLKKLDEQYDADDVKRILREGDVSSLGITKSEELCLWADTQKFWAWSVSERNAELREAAREFMPGFQIVPNWGSMSGFRATDSRRLEAKNVRLWKNGTDILFYEDEYYPGKVAPGYTLDFIIPYKYACACGIRSLELPYRGAEHQPVYELAVAESAAWGGDAVLQGIHSPKVRPVYGELPEFDKRRFSGPYDFTDVREKYQGFWDSHRDWFAGRTSYAEVGIVLSFDEIHMENTHHMREAYSLAHDLADHHILFDFLCESQIVPEELDRFRLVIVPHVQYLPESARAAILEYADRGGKVVITGSTGMFDENGKASQCKDMLASLLSQSRYEGENLVREQMGKGTIVWINDVFELLPKKAWQPHDIVDIPITEMIDGGRLDEITEAAKHDPPDEGLLAKLYDELTGRTLSVLGDAPAALRASAWVSDTSIVVHLINYDVPLLAERGTVAVTPVENIAVSVPVPDGLTPERIEYVDLWSSETTLLDFALVDGRVEFTVPRVDVYRIVRVA